MLLNSYLLKRKQKEKKKFLLYFAIHRRNEGVVTYGIRAGSTRDLGFTTDVLNTVGVLSVFVIVIGAARALPLSLQPTSIFIVMVGQGPSLDWICYNHRFNQVNPCYWLLNNGICY